MWINYTDGVKILRSCFLFLRNKSVTASPLTLPQQTRLAGACDRWRAHTSRLLRCDRNQGRRKKGHCGSTNCQGGKIPPWRRDCGGVRAGLPVKDKAELQHAAPRTGGSRMVPRATGRLPELQQPAGFLWGQRPAQLWLCLVPRARLPALPSGHMPRVTLLELQAACSFEFAVK